ncbi:MAG: dihydrofolate reductase family protein [Pseudomonadota bacterium]
MQPIIYDVAVSADGFICGPDADISRFPHHGPVVDSYRARLATYGTALIGRKTYTFGYAHGLPQGANPYPHMRSIVISQTLDLPDDAAVEQHPDLTAIPDLKAQADRPIYLCGGGHLASTLLQADLIDQVVLKRAPILLGSGVPLWGRGAAIAAATLVDHQDYGDGVTLQRYQL